MSGYRVAAAARSDLEGIWFYIAQDNPEAADKLLKTIVSKFILLGSRPEIGRKREEVAPKLRSFPVARYVIFYRLLKREIEIVRVLHGARDLPALFN